MPTAHAQALNNCDVEDATAIAQIVCPVMNILNILIVAAGLFFVIFVIFSGIKYVMAQGDPKGLMAAQQSLTYAIIGLVIILGFFATTNIIAGVTGTNTQTVGGGVATPINSLLNAIEDLVKWGDFNRGDDIDISLDTTNSGGSNNTGAGGVSPAQSGVCAAAADGGVRSNNCKKYFYPVITETGPNYSIGQTSASRTCSCAAVPSGTGCAVDNVGKITQRCQSGIESIAGNSCVCVNKGGQEDQSEPGSCTSVWVPGAGLSGSCGTSSNNCGTGYAPEPSQNSFNGSCECNCIR